MGKLSTRDRLLETSNFLFRTRGYHNTSIADIANACGLRKASVYHHISSKQALALEVLATLNNDFEKKIFHFAYEENKSEITRFKSLILAIEAFFIDHEGGCLMGNLALEVFDFLPEFQSAIIRFFDNWIAALTHLFIPKYGHPEAIRLAQDVVASTQGAIMLCRLYKSNQPLIQLRARLLALLEENQDIPTNTPAISTTV